MSARTGLRIRKLADRSEGERVAVYTPDGTKRLVNPATGKPEPWPLLGVMIEGAVLPEARVPTSFVTRGLAEGWITLEGERIAHAAGGPPDNPWAVTHTFIEADVIVLHLVGEPLRYRVIHNPGKHPDGEGTRVDWFYDVEVVGSDG